MAKYYGAVGYATSTNERGVVTSSIEERWYCGDSIRVSRRTGGSNEVNENITLGNQISIVSDPYALQNFCNIKYATFMGIKWKVTTVDVQYPRLILTLGDVYNGQTGPTRSP